MLLAGIIFIIFALVLYTIAVWAERIKKHLETWIVYIFASGFLCDLIGTSIMFYISKHKFEINVHSVFGYGALIIMFFHLIWAIFSKRKPKYEKYFTKFSVFAWGAWLIAFFTGAFLNM